MVLFRLCHLSPAASAAQTAAMDRMIQDKDELLREERTKRRAANESQKLMIQLQFQKDKQVQPQQQQQLADQSAETIRVTNQLHDVQAIHFQHVQVEKANNGNSRASAEQIQQQQLSLKEGVPPKGAPTLIHQTMPLQTQSDNDSTRDSDKQDLWSTSRKMAKILPIFFLMTIICNEAHSSTDNMIRSSLVIPTRGSTVKPASRDTSEFGGQTRTKLSRSDQSQRMQLTNLGQTVQQQPTPTPHSVQCLRTNETEAFFINGCTGITTSPHMKLFSMGSLPLCTTANLWGNIYGPNSPTGQFQSLIERTTNPFPYSIISLLPISVRIIATIIFFTVTFFSIILPQLKCLYQILSW
jgi:hypothetical protein